MCRYRMQALKNNQRFLILLRNTNELAKLNFLKSRVMISYANGAVTHRNKFVTHISQGDFKYL